MGRRKKGEDDSTIKSRLVDRLGELLISRGLAALTMDEVSKTFRVSKKTLYRFFPTREDMVLQVVRIFTSRIAAYAEKKIRKIEAQGPDAFVPQITDLMTWIGSLILSIPPSLLEDLERKSPLLFERMDALRREVIMRMFSRMMEVGKKMGKVRTDLDTEVVAHVYSGMIRQIASRKGISPTRAPYDVFLTALKIIFDGILTGQTKTTFETAVFPRFSSTDPWELSKQEGEE